MVFHNAESATVHSEIHSITIRPSLSLLLFVCVPLILQYTRSIRLVVDHEYETSSTEDDSATEAQRNRLSSVNINSHSNINESIYQAPNGFIIRTQQAAHSNNIKLTPPIQMRKHFKKLDKLAMTQKERVPLSSLVTVDATGSEQNITTQPVSRPENTASNVVKGECKRTQNVHDQESIIDTEEERDLLGSHIYPTLSDEEELWMGPWSNLHIPMTKL